MLLKHCLVTCPVDINKSACFLLIILLRVAEYIVWVLDDKKFLGMLTYSEAALGYALRSCKKMLYAAPH